MSAWLEPAAQARELPGTSRTAACVGDGRFAIAGIGAPGDPQRPGGLALVDTRTWSIRTLDADLESAEVSQGLIIGTGSRSGLAVFDRDGRLVYRRFADRSCGVELVHRGRVCARVGGERGVCVLELASGKQLGTRPESPPRLLLGARG